MVTHFTELIVYEKSVELARRIFAISSRWPKEERYSLTDQIRRAARSVGANLAESWGKRRYETYFVSKLTDSDGENHEVEHWLLTALEDGYLAQQEFVELLELKREVGRMLGGMIQDPNPFLLRN
jgi:four helix bundle protein